MPDRAARVVAVRSATDAAEARRVADRLGLQSGLDAEDRARLALVVTEAATNVLKHAGEGQLLLALIRRGEVQGVEVLALDRGPGIGDLVASAADGYSTAGSSGTGLGAMRRNAAEFDIHSAAGQGTAILARIWPRRARLPAAALDVGGVCVPHPGEDVSGDAWDESPNAGGARVMVVDGLGHGPFAREAAQQALSVLRSLASEEPGQALLGCHAALRSTRGAAVALADVDLERRTLRFAGVGNVAAVILSDGGGQHLVSANGTVGHGTFRVREHTYPWPPHGTLVLSSDGIQSRWSLDAPGLLARDPSLLAAVLFRDHARGRDDATVVVARERR